MSTRDARSRAASAVSWSSLGRWEAVGCSIQGLYQRLALFVGTGALCLLSFAFRLKAYFQSLKLAQELAFRASLRLPCARPWLGQTRAFVLGAASQSAPHGRDIRVVHSPSAVSKSEARKLKV